MKRALAERAKQEADEPSSVPVLSNPSIPSEDIKNDTTTSTDDTPPLKMPRKSLSSPVPPQGGGSEKKRGRYQSPLPPSAVNEKDEPEDEEQSKAFYLKNQNKAMASELYRYKRTITVLTQERDERRKALRLVAKAIGDFDAIWSGVEGEIRSLLQQNYHSKSKVHLTLPQDTPPSTGEGTDVETILEAMTSITQLSSSPFESALDRNNVLSSQTDDPNNQDHSIMDDHDIQTHLNYLQTLSKAAQNFSNRCIQFQELLLKFVTRISSLSSTEDENTHATATEHRPYDRTAEIAKYHQQIASLQTSCEAFKAQLDELAKSRDEANESERRVRRGLYRIASGRMSITEVLQAVDKDGSSSLADLDQIKQDVSDVAARLPVPTTSVDAKVKSESQQDEDVPSESGFIMLDGEAVTSSDIVHMKKKIDDLELINTDREMRINELLDEKETHEKIMNEFLSKQKFSSIGKSDVKSSPDYVELSAKLSAAEKIIENQKMDLQSVRDRWATTKGDLELAKKTVSDLELKHRRRLRELVGASGNDVSTEDEDIETADQAYVDQAKTVMELEHKLKHALDHVRQAESVRRMLGDAHTLNEILKREINELKSISAEISESNPEAFRDKEIMKERERLQIILKERDALLDMNQRLQQQCVEKDEMNAKSLSSILHLKQLSEQLEQEKHKMEKALKSAQQLALNARLAANAKVRVEEEAVKEKEAALEETKHLRDELESLRQQKIKIDTELAVCFAKMAESKEESNSIRQRCDEIIAEATRNEQERRHLHEALLVAKKDVAEAAKKVATMQTSTRSGSTGAFETEFTAEELTIQVNALKSRLACPVCNTRDKKVINTRCRHMFCRQCVDKSLENRNRKCPSCGIKFDKKDIEDVWF